MKQALILKLVGKPRSVMTQEGSCTQSLSKKGGGSDRQAVTGKSERESKPRTPKRLSTKNDNGSKIRSRPPNDELNPSEVRANRRSGRNKNSPPIFEIRRRRLNNTDRREHLEKRIGVTGSDRGSTCSSNTQVGEVAFYIS